jgi:hypothetical protein
MRARQKVEDLLQQQAASRQQVASRHIASQRLQQQQTLAGLRQRQLAAAEGQLQQQGAVLLAHCEALQRCAGEHGD